MSVSVHEVVNPATEESVRTIDLVGVEETDAAIAAAVRVGPAWRGVTPADRGRLLRRFGEVVDDHLGNLTTCLLRDGREQRGDRFTAPLQR